MQQMRIRYSDYFTVECSGSTSVVRFEIRTLMDTASIQDLADDLYALVDQQGIVNLVLDLAGVRFLSSQALGALVNLQRKARAAGGSLVLAHVGENIARMFRVSRLDNLLTFQEQTDEAVADAPGCCRMMGKPAGVCNNA